MNDNWNPFDFNSQSSSRLATALGMALYYRDEALAQEVTSILRDRGEDWQKAYREALARWSRTTKGDHGLGLLSEEDCNPDLLPQTLAELDEGFEELEPPPASPAPPAP